MSQRLIICVTNSVNLKVPFTGCLNSLAHLFARQNHLKHCHYSLGTMTVVLCNITKTKSTDQKLAQQKEKNCSERCLQRLRKLYVLFLLIVV